MEHAINHSLGFKTFLKWLFHTVKIYFFICLYNYSKGLRPFGKLIF